MLRLRPPCASTDATQLLCTGGPNAPKGSQSSPDGRGRDRRVWEEAVFDINYRSLSVHAAAAASAGTASRVTLSSARTRHTTSVSTVAGPGWAGQAAGRDQSPARRRTSPTRYRVKTAGSAVAVMLMPAPYAARHLCVSLATVFPSQSTASILRLLVYRFLPYHRQLQRNARSTAPSAPSFLPFQRWRADG